MSSIDFERINQLTKQIIACAMEVHKNLGPVFLESVYKEALCIELDLKGIPYRRQIEIDVEYKGHFIKEQRLDMLVDDLVIVENKAVSEVLTLHKMVVMSYLKATQNVSAY